MKNLIGFLVVVGIAAGAAGFWFWKRDAEPAIAFRTAAITRGDLVATISATGTIEPEEVIDVGAQVAGMISKLGPDPKDSSKTIDYGSQVEAGTVLAQIDDAIYRTQVLQARATLQRAQADLIQLKARVYQREREWSRIQNLASKGKANVAETTYDAAQADYESARSALSVGEAQIAQSEAALEQAETNLGYTTIKSPVKGVIIDRRVNVGQTVVASFNAPSLFLIAKDLRRLEVWAAVNEADIGRIHPGQRVTFTVDAFPDQAFEGEVAQTRLNATMTQNVVTYTVVVNTDNPDGKLLPYLTANLNFETGRRDNVLQVPNAALRWTPSPSAVAPAYRPEQSASAARPAAHAEGDQPRRGTVWLAEGGFVRPVSVELGLSNDQATEITGGEINAGTQVVVGEVQGAADETTTNPFTPQFRSPRRQ